MQFPGLVCSYFLSAPYGKLELISSLSLTQFIVQGLNSYHLDIQFIDKKKVLSTLEVKLSFLLKGGW